ncbi:purine-nucleoside phosphorylase [bacterium]|nr:purine-nucleoside phosphorylase [bacterium]
MLIEDTVNYIKGKTNNFNPEVALILGSGLGEFADEYCDIVLKYADIPGFEASTVKGHKGQLVFAKIAGKRVVMMQGRFHYYEGHSIQRVVYPVKVFKKLGVKNLIVTNAAGGINEKFKASDLMLITDHINFMHVNPLIGPNDDDLGPRFPDMTEVYKKDLQELALSVAKKLDIDLKKGVYMALSGPNYETPSETKMLKILGADAVGMSTVPEAMVANYCGIKVLGISCISNSAAGITGEVLSHQEVIEAANAVKGKFKNLLFEIIKNI